LKPEQLDYVGFYDKPLMKFNRLLETYLAYAPAGFTSFCKAMPVWLREKLHLPRQISRGLPGRFKKRCMFIEHHESHAASAFFPSPFEEAAILTLDGVGEWATATIGHGRGHRITITRELHFPHSLGLLYSAFTYYCGFTVNSGEYKLMGLAPYGEPKYVEVILDKLIDLKDDGSFRMDMSYFNYCQGLTMTGPKFDQLFGAPPRRPDGPMEPLYMDLAASIQKVTEQIVLRAARHAHELTGMKDLCLAGGVALNCVANGRLLVEGPFENIWIQPAAGDAGGALGVAQFIWHQILDYPRQVNPADQQQGSLLGPAYSDADLRSFLDSVQAPYELIEDDARLCETVAHDIAEGRVIGWYQGRMEFGPRALGSRSILGDARDPKMQTTINMKVKFREGFRPFAPAVLAEHAHEFFGLEQGQESPYMLLVAPVREEKRKPIPQELRNVEGLGRLLQDRSVVPSITHVDYSARVQSVDPHRHGLYRKVIEAFHEKTGCPVIVNTSFNLSWEPIVCTPQEAFGTFMASNIDVLCMGHCLLRKDRQPASVEAMGDSGRDSTFEEVSRSPRTGGELRFDGTNATCVDTGHVFEREGGVWRMFWPHEQIDSPSDVTEMVKAFYERTPFPNYDEHDSLRSLMDKARKGAYAAALDRAIPHNATVLEVGCGTGQLSNFLGIGCRRVVGTDICLNSLRLAEEFRKKHELWRVRFVQMNLFRPCFMPGQFDVVLCNGVLHHTADPRGGFERLVPLVKPGGYIVVGLYNRCGRLMTDLRRQAFRMTGGRARWIDPILRKMPIGEEKRRAWFADQYRNPHESKHTMGEVLAWFDDTGVQFVRGIPSLTPVLRELGCGNVFDPAPRGSRLDRAIVQAQQIVRGNKEGGFFVMIGRRPAEKAEPGAEPAAEAAVETAVEVTVA
jgi:carbamoyltransferase